MNFSNLSVKIAALLLTLSSLTIAQTASADANSCPAELVRPLSGAWIGTALLTQANGSASQSGTRDVFRIKDCSTFEVTVNYLDSQGNIARILHFFAVSDPSKGTFNLVDGSITEGSAVVPMTGTIQIPQAGEVHGNFLGAVGGHTAYLSEVMHVNGNELTRTIQMYADSPSGPYIGTRIVHDKRSL